MTPDHPVLLWAGIVGGVIAVVAVASPRVLDVVRAWRDDADTRRLRRGELRAEFERQKLQHQAQVEAAATILNDQRVEALVAQLNGISAQLEAQRIRYEGQIHQLSEQLSDTQAALDEALAEIGELRKELAEYRDSTGGRSMVGIG